jgi:hypothetical protein
VEVGGVKTRLIDALGREGCRRGIYKMVMMPASAVMRPTMAGASEPVKLECVRVMTTMQSVMNMVHQRMSNDIGAVFGRFNMTIAADMACFHL